MVTPIAKNPDGSSITGPVLARIYDAPAGATTSADHPRPRLRHGHAGQLRYHQGHADEARIRRWAAACPCARATGRSRIAGKTPFPGTPDPVKVCLKGGFDPAILYELTYIAKDPPVLGIGFAATRDLMSFLRRGDAGQSARADDPSHGDRTGTSQSGNYLRSFLHLGFNQDERGRACSTA